jgi:hypothetical protein
MPNNDYKGQVASVTGAGQGQRRSYAGCETARADGVRMGPLGAAPFVISSSFFKTERLASGKRWP